MDNYILIRTAPEADGTRHIFRVAIPDGDTAEGVYLNVVAHFDPEAELPELLNTAAVA